MYTLFFVLATLVAGVLLAVGMFTPYTWLFGVGAILFALVFIVGLNPGRKNGPATHHGH